MFLVTQTQNRSWPHFWDLYGREVQWLIDNEYARTAEDVLWRRSKLGLRLSEDEIAGLEHWMQTKGIERLENAS